MPEEPNLPHIPHLKTGGNYSPGIVMGNYTLNAALRPMAIPLAEAFKLRLEFRPSNRGYFADAGNGENHFIK
jgi:hypothetical protein